MKPSKKIIAQTKLYIFSFLFIIGGKIAKSFSPLPLLIAFIISGTNIRIKKANMKIQAFHKPISKTGVNHIDFNPYLILYNSLSLLAPRI
jgi:hypothetical protein